MQTENNAIANDWRAEAAQRDTELNALLARHNITVESVFVPYSRSRNFVQGAPASKQSLNWRVTLKRDGREILTTDYSAGIAHCPSYKQGARWTLDYNAAIASECETGRKARRFSRGDAINPKPLDVIYSLVMDSDALDYATFEDWASEYGYDADSRSAEKTYRACLEIALKLRAGLGDSLLSELREAFQDY